MRPASKLDVIDSLAHSGDGGSRASRSCESMRVPYHLHVRVTAREYDVVHIVAEEDGTTISHIIRRLIRALAGRRQQAKKPEPSGPKR